MQRIQFCGLTIDLTQPKQFTTFLKRGFSGVCHSFIAACFPRSSVDTSLTGCFLCLTSAFLHSLPQCGDVLTRLLQFRPWPLPRPPERIWATDAAPHGYLVAVDQWDLPVFQVHAPCLHIYALELLAVAMAVANAPGHAAIAVDNKAVIGAFRRSHWPSHILLSASMLMAWKDISMFYIRTCYNPVDRFTRRGRSASALGPQPISSDH